MKKIIPSLLIGSLLLFTSCHSKDVKVQNASLEQVSDEELEKEVEQYFESLEITPDALKALKTQAIEIQKISYSVGSSRNGNESQNEGGPAQRINLEGKNYFGGKVKEFRLVFTDSKLLIGRYKMLFDDTVAKVHLPRDQYPIFVDLLEMNERTLFLLTEDGLNFVYADLLVHKKLK